MELNNLGQAAFLSTLAGTSGGTADNTGIFRGNGGALTQIVREGQAAPDNNGAFNVLGGLNAPQSIQLNDSGQVAFHASLSGTAGGGSSDNSGIFRGSGGAISQIARAGQASPDANGTFSGFLNRYASTNLGMSPSSPD